jgi:thiol-disulfide isomerase/thioredoxin
MPSRVIALLTVFVVSLTGCSDKAKKATATAPDAKKAEVIAPPDPGSKIDVADLLERARKALVTGSPMAESFLREALVAEPTNRAALLMLAIAIQTQAQSVSRPESSPLYLRSGEAARRLLATHPMLSGEDRNRLAAILYNEACTHAIQGESARALNALAEAYSLGFNRIELLDNDTELDSLRALPSFAALQKAVEQHAVEVLLAKSRGSAPRFEFDLPNLDGKRLRIADLKGKVAIILLWGTGCVPGRKELPILAALDKRYREKGLAVVGIAYEETQGAEAIAAVREMARSRGSDFPILIGDEATERQVPDFLGLPSILLLDRDGRIRYRATGYQPYAALEIAAVALLEEGKPNAEVKKP